MFRRYPVPSGHCKQVVGGPWPPRTWCPFWFSLMQVEYRAKHRKEGSHGLSMLGRPDIEMAKKAAKLSSQVTQMGEQQL